MNGLDILWILAHPDDESFGHAGMMLLAQDLGFTTGYVCATLGDVGEIRDLHLASKASLAAVRELELRRAMTMAGLNELRLLGYRDSGMAGTPENDDPRCLYQANPEEVVARLIGTIRELRPNAVVTFGPDGVYGHPDHIKIGALTDRAVIEAASDGQPGLGEPWRIGALYHVGAPRERIIASRTNPESPYFNQPLEVLEKLGNPSEEITHWIDVSTRAEGKHDILMQHATQISRDSPIADPANPLTRLFLSVETLIQCDLPWTTSEDDPITAIRNRYPYEP